MPYTQKTLGGEILCLEKLTIDEIDSIARENPKLFAEYCINQGIWYPEKPSLMNNLNCFIRLKEKFGAATNVMTAALMNYVRVEL